MSRPMSMATQERLDIHTVSSSVGPPPDDTVIDAGAFSLSTELQPESIVGKSICTVSHSSTHLKYVYRRSNTIIAHHHDRDRCGFLKSVFRKTPEA